MQAQRKEGREEEEERIKGRGGGVNIKKEEKNISEIREIREERKERESGGGGQK